MALFEFDAGRLIPAQFGRPVQEGLSPEVVDAVRNQVLEVVARPLFPVTWHDVAPVGAGIAGGAPRLTALDATGQVISIEVMAHLDAVTLMGALSRLSDISTMGWAELAMAYPGGPEAFRAGWAEFRGAMPTTPQQCPRLVLVVGSIDDAVRPALDVLGDSGLEVHEISVREMSNGRRFLEVQTASSHSWGHSPSLLGGRASRIPELSTWADEPEGISGGSAGLGGQNALLGSEFPPVSEVVPPVRAASGVPVSVIAPPTPHAFPQVEVVHSDDLEVASPPPAPPAASAPPAPPVSGGQDQREPAPQVGVIPVQEPAAALAPSAPPAPPAPQSAPVSPAPPAMVAPDAGAVHAMPGRSTEAEGSHAGAAAGDVPAVLGRDAEGLGAIATILGEDTPLVWIRIDDNQRFEALLRADGLIEVGSVTTLDPGEATRAASGMEGVDGWLSWFIGDEMGPSLAEALTEINNEIAREEEAREVAQAAEQRRRGTGAGAVPDGGVERERRFRH